MKNTLDRTKLKILIKAILISRYPKGLTAAQLTDIINNYEWGFKSSVTSSKIGKLLGYELSKHDTNFLKDLYSRKKNGANVYYISLK